MSNYVKISTLCYGEPLLFEEIDFSTKEKRMMKFLKEQLDKVLCESPDLIVFPECANRFALQDPQNNKEYYCYVEDRFLDYMKSVAKNNNVNIAYSAVRVDESIPQKPFKNSNIYINKKGEICGIYDKNHLVVEENSVSDTAYGTKANLIQLDFGSVATAICFDLNFNELLFKYKPQHPDLIVFSSNYHGGLKQAQWAYECRSYFVGAVKGARGGILNPFGEEVAYATNYTDYATATVNLDYELCHLDYNRPKIAAAKAKYKDALNIFDPGYVGAVMLSSEAGEVSAKDIINEFEIETLDHYIERALKHREQNMI